MGHSVPRYLLSGVERGTVTEASEDKGEGRKDDPQRGN